MFDMDVLTSGNPLEVSEGTSESVLEAAALEGTGRQEMAVPLEAPALLDGTQPLVTVLGLSDEEQDIYLAICTDAFPDGTVEMSLDGTVEMAPEGAAEMAMEGTVEMALEGTEEMSANQTVDRP